MCLESDGHMKEGTAKLEFLDFEIMNTCLAISVEVWDLNDVTSFNASWNGEPEVDGLFDVFKLNGEGVVLCVFFCFLLGFFLFVLLFALAACSFAWMEVGAGGFGVSRLLALAAASLFFGLSPALARASLRASLRAWLRTWLRAWLRRRWRSGEGRWLFLCFFLIFLVVHFSDFAKFLEFFGELEEVGGFLISRSSSMFLVDLVGVEVHDFGTVDLLDFVGAHGVGEPEERHVAFCLLC